jgi:hypothetical protein
MTTSFMRALQSDLDLTGGRRGACRAEEWPPLLVRLEERPHHGQAAAAGGEADRPEF